MSGMTEVVDIILYGWPYLALACGISMSFRVLLQPSWYEQPSKLLELGMPIYMLHQFEEHGIDLHGKLYAFQQFMCSTVFPGITLSECAASRNFIFAVNVGAVWISTSLGSVYGMGNPLLGCTGCLAIPAVNIFGHLMPAILTRSYNPGLCTALVLFIPYVLWSYTQLYQKRLISSAEILLSLLFGGVLTHVSMIITLKLRAGGELSELALCGLQVLTGFLPLAVGYLRRPSIAFKTV